MSDIQTGDKRISSTRFIAAPPSDIWAVLTDTGRHSEIDGSGTVKGASGEGKVLSREGDTFGMQMKIGLPYPIRNTVVEFEPMRLLAWRHAGRHRWRYELEPVDGGTSVTETFDWSKAPLGPLYGPLGFIKGHCKSIPATLARLDALVTPASS